MTSKGTVSALLKEVYNAHVLTVESLTNHIEVLVRKCDRLTKFKDDILARGKDLQHRYDQLCEEHRLTQRSMVDAMASETDGTKVPGFLNLDNEIGTRFPGFEPAGIRTGRQQDSLGLDSCDGSVSRGCSSGEGEKMEDTGGQRRLKLANGRKRIRYSEEEKQLQKKKVKLSRNDASPVQHEGCRRKQENRSGGPANIATSIISRRVKTHSNSERCNNISTTCENNHTKDVIPMECVTRSRKCSIKQTNDTFHKGKASADSQYKKGCGRQNNSRKTSTQKQRRDKDDDAIIGDSNQPMGEGQSGRTDVLRLSETHSTPEKGDSSQVLFIPETCYPDSCDPNSSHVAMDTIDPGHLHVSGNVPPTAPMKSQAKKQNHKMQCSDVDITPIKSSQAKKQNHKMHSGDTATSPIKTPQNCNLVKPRGSSRVTTSDKCCSSAERDAHQGSVCSEDGNESGDVSEVFLLPEAKLLGAFNSPLCNSTPVDSTNRTTCKIGSPQKFGATRCHENPSCDKLECVTPKFLSLHDNPAPCSPKRDNRKNRHPNSAGSPLLFDDDVDGIVKKHKGHQRSHVCQISDDSDSMVRTRSRNRLGGRSDVGQADETVTRGQLLSSSIDASKPVDSIFFKDAEPGSCSVNTAHKTRKGKLDAKMSVMKMATGDSTSRKLVQMTLSQHLQPNADRVVTTATISRSDEEERLLIERAKKASLQDLDVLLCYSKVPQTEAPDTLASDFKEPMTPHKKEQHKDSHLAVSPHRRRDRADACEVVPETVPEDWEEQEGEVDRQVNGSVDPDIRLSAYIFTQSNRHEDAERTVRENPLSERDNGEREVDSCAPSVVFAPLRRQQMMPPETVDEDLSDEEDCTEQRLDVEPDDSMKETKAHDDSFDRVPKASRPNYAYRDVVRKQAERRQLEATVCPQCEQYFSTLGLSDEEKKERMKSCRHRNRFAPPQTPEHFWSVGFPDTQECEDRGYIHVTQVRPSRFRRKRGLKKLFNDTEEDREINDVL